MQWKVTHNLPEVAQEFYVAAQIVESARPTVLRAIGVQLLSWGFQDFRAKSKGETAGGIAWKPITESAIVTRLAARTPYKNNLAKRRTLTAEEKVLTKDIAKGMRAGAAHAKQRAGVAAAFYNATPRLRALQRDRAKLYLQRDTMIAKEWQGAKIGVDTARLVNSLIAGVPEIGVKPVASKQQGPVQPAVFQVSGATVTVGTNMSYAADFDKLRPIFGPGFVDQARQTKLVALANRAHLLALKSKGVKHLEVKVD